MRVPLSWLAEVADVPGGTTGEQVAAALVSVGLEEEALHGGAVTGPVVVGRVLEVVAEPQKNGKTIRWCQVDVGPEHAPDGGGPRGIVCGADNFAVGDLVVVALPGAVLPGPFAISARRTYGHVSDGMICSARELELGDDHAGILVLTAPGLEPGTDAVAALGLAEETVEVNVTPDRGYCFSVRGVGREYAHATATTGSFRDPADVDAPPATADGYPVVLDDGAPLRGRPGCDRFVARIVRGVDPTAPTPQWMRRRLQQAGMRPISLAVDVTNYVMLGVGQPLHAYDLATLHGPVVVRRARSGERLTTLDGVERALHAEDLLISDSDGAGRVLGIAGVMGGADSEVSPTTTDVLVEAAHFDPVSVARSARRHRLPSEASRRFERGSDPGLCAAAAELVVRLLVEHGGGTAGPEVTDEGSPAAPTTIRIDPQLPARLVGVPYASPVVEARLREIGCTVGRLGDDLGVTPPSWRPDLVADVDLVEEVARLEGYEHIPSVLPGAPAGRGLTPAQLGRRTASRALAEGGWTEVLSYPFVAPGLADDLGLPADDPRRESVRLVNPLSEEQPLMRTSVLSTLVDVLRRNVSRGAVDCAVFEVGSVTRPTAPTTAPTLRVDVRPSDDDLADLLAAVPPQPTRVAGLACGLVEPAGWWGPGRPAETTDALEAAVLVADRLGVPLVVEPDTHAPWHPGRCARLTTADGALVGHAGELHPAVCERLGLPARTVAFEVELDVLLDRPAPVVRAVPVSPFPVVKEDVALVVAVEVAAADVERALLDGGGELLESVRLFDVYAGAQVGEARRLLAFALRMRAPDRTLTGSESAAVRTAAVEEATRRFGAVLRGA